jgi:cysteine synthase A
VLLTALIASMLRVSDTCGTGREIWQQTRGKLHAFVSGAGTGGTIAGVSRALKDLNPSIQIVLADPQGSSLFNKVGLKMTVM